MVVDVDWDGSGLKRCRLAAFFFLRAGPAAIAVNADSQGGGWGQLRLECMCMCVCVCVVCVRLSCA